MPAQINLLEFLSTGGFLHIAQSHSEPAKFTDTPNLDKLTKQLQKSPMSKPKPTAPRIRQVDTTALIPSPRNAKKHDEIQIAKIAGSIKEFGFGAPIITDGENGILAGHGRWLAAQKLGLEKVPCIEMGHLTETQRRAYMLADNRLAEIGGGWDMDALRIELDDLAAEEIDLDALGFGDDFEIDLGGDEPEPGLTDDDSVPEPPEQPITVEGDVWTLGRHRLMCGDSTNPDHLKNLTAGKKWDVCVFDPPYEIEELYNSAMPQPHPGAKLLLMWDFKRFAVAPSAALSAGWESQYELIWDNVTSWYTPNRPLARHKSCGVFGDDPFWNFDAAIIRDGKKREAKTVHNTRGDCDYVPLDGAVHMRTIESFPTTAESGGHAHSKPAAWIEAMFRGVGGNVYLDLFGGSGTSLIVCEKLKTECLMMELDPSSCDVIIQRWQEFTGGFAVNEQTGKKFKKTV